MTLPFLDTNILVYAHTDDPRAEPAQALLADGFVIGVQTLNEFVSVARRRLGMSWFECRDAVDALVVLASVVLPTEQADLSTAMELAEQYKLSLFDALMLALALRAECPHFYSEDMHAGLVVRGSLEIVNPFR